MSDARDPYLGLNNHIRQQAREQAPTYYAIGKILSLRPLKIRADGLDLDRDDLRVPESMYSNFIQEKPVEGRGVRTRLPMKEFVCKCALSIGVACAVMLSMVRVLPGISIYWILVPGYALALILARYVPSVFVGIAFDSGGVASGPMTSTFLLPLAMGACTALGGNVVTDAFGVVALVALAPPVAIQIMGVIYVHRAKAVAEDKADLLPDDGVIDLEDEEI